MHAIYIELRKKYLWKGQMVMITRIIDPGFNVNTITNMIDQLNCFPIAVLLTHAHFDHGIRAEKLKNHYKIPLMYNKKDHKLGYLARKPADRWLKEEDVVEVGEITLNVLETPGHSPGSMCYYTKDVKMYNGKEIDGIIFTGDLIFRREIGRTDMPGGDLPLLFSSIKNKIIYNHDLSDNFTILPGHKAETSIGQEKEYNNYKEYFL